jgi:flagellar basal body-associated protein FliL
VGITAGSREVPGRKGLGQETTLIIIIIIIIIIISAATTASSLRLFRT